MSGSWGNSHFVRAGETGILIDAGQSGKQILANMAASGCGSQSAIKAIIVTHAHRDHVAGVGVLARLLGVDVYATEGTWFEMNAIIGDIPEKQHKTIECSGKWSIGCLDIEAFPTSHDALESVGYVIRSEEKALGIATDAGVFTSRMEQVLRDMHLLVLEANHDLDMLRTGKYPYFLKKRIAGINGHLSNNDAGNALRKIAGNETRHVVLAHLSQENNTWEKAMETVMQAVPHMQQALSVAPRCTPGQRICIA